MKTSKVLNFFLTYFHCLSTTHFVFVSFQACFSSVVLVCFIPGISISFPMILLSGLDFSSFILIISAFTMSYFCRFSFLLAGRYFCVMNEVEWNYILIVILYVHYVQLALVQILWVVGLDIYGLCHMYVSCAFHVVNVIVCLWPNATFTLNVILLMNIASHVYEWLLCSFGWIPHCVYLI